MKNGEWHYVVVSLSDRFLAYIVDIVFLLSISTFISALSGAEPVLYKISVYYLYGHHGIVKEITSRDGLIFLLHYFILSTTYFFFESYYGWSVGKYMLRMSTARLKGGNTFLRCLIRGIIKTVPVVVIVDALFALKRRLKQRESDRILKFVVVKLKGTEVSWKNYILLAIILYYLPLIAIIGVAYCYPWANVIPAPSPNGTPPPKPSSQQWTLIFMNNFSIDYQYYIMGGLTLLFISVLYLYGGSFLTGKMIGDSLLTHPSLVLYGILPHFFIETFGYVCGIAAGIYITKLLIVLVEGYFERRDSTYIGEILLMENT